MKPTLQEFLSMTAYRRVPLYKELYADSYTPVEVLRMLNPSPYMFYFSGDDMEIAGASPETLVKLEDGRLSTFPLAGTRARGRNEEEDQALEHELLADEKERAEHNMLVDLGRNDLGKISQIGSVKVEQYLTVRRYSHVMHIASTVTGRIQSGKEAADAVDAVLPAGTLSGAPKVRACRRYCRALRIRRRERSWQYPTRSIRSSDYSFIQNLS